ncbi:hypothetical protein ACJMK2_021205 [Sinanodonta woodiana]|uniref:Uncharacterized protein n=1 Tax=Sinanodonta woodiana TaxID=1069815 RepID=A0ABD3U3S2_SINWO
MDDFGNSSGGFSSSDTAGCSTDTGGCSAISNSDTGGMLPPCGGSIDSGPFSVDTFSNIGIASTCDLALGASGYAQCDLAGNNAYYDVCFQNNMEHENISSTCNQIEDKELMVLRSNIAQLQIMLACSEGDEKKNAAITAKIWDLTARMESKGNMRGQYNIGLSNYPNHVSAVTNLSEAAAFYQCPQSAGFDMQTIYKARRNGWIGLIIFAVIAATIVIAVSLTVGR